MIKIKLGSVQLVGMFLVLISSLIVAAFAAGQSNPYFSSPLIALLVMFYIGHLPLSGKRDWFLFAYVLLVLGSGAILMLTPEKIY